MTARLRPELADLPAYTPGKTVPGAVKTASNETVDGPLPSVRAVDGLVAGDLDRAGHRLAGGVGGQVGQFGSKAGGHPKQSRGVRDAALPSAVPPVYASSSAVLGIAFRSGTLGIGQEACQSGRMGLTANELSG